MTTKNKLPYEMVEPKVLELTAKIGSTNSIEEQIDILDQISNYIELCGWSFEEWQEETVRRIDTGWDEDNKWLN